MKKTEIHKMISKSVYFLVNGIHFKIVVSMEAGLTNTFPTHDLMDIRQLHNDTSQFPMK